MNKLVNRITILVITTLCFSSCMITPIEENWEYCGIVYKRIDLISCDGSDSLIGYYTVIDGDCLFISEFDKNNYNTACVYFDPTADIVPYKIFSRDTDMPYGLSRNMCDLSGGGFGEAWGPLPDNVDYRNVVYPLEKVNDSVFMVKHVACEYNSPDQLVRELLVDKNLEIISFTTYGEKENNYFFYD